MLSVITLASKKLTILHYTTALNVSKKENDTNYRFEIFYAWEVIVTLQSIKNILLAWDYIFQGGDKVGYLLDRSRIHSFN